MPHLTPLQNRMLKAVAWFGPMKPRLLINTLTTRENFLSEREVRRAMEELIDVGALDINDRRELIVTDKI